MNCAVDAAVRFRFKNLMNRTGEPSVAELKAQLAAHAAEIAALKAEKEALSQRIVKLEEELALARLHRFAPRSEKHVDRLFNEAEQVADEDVAGGEDGDVVDLPNTGLSAIESTTGKKRGRRPLPENLPRERVEYDLPDDQGLSLLSWSDASHGRDRYRAASYRGEGEGSAECAVQICLPPLRPHRDQHANRYRADARATLAGQHRHGLDAGLRARSQICRAHRSTVWPRPSSAPGFLSAVALWVTG